MTGGAHAALRSVFEGFRGAPGPAYRHVSGDLSFAELHARSGALAARLATQSEARAPVILWGHKHRDTQLAYWACLLAGRPLIPVETDTPPARLEGIARSCGAALVLGAAPNSPPPPVAGVPAWDASAPPDGPARVPPGAACGDVAYIMYSSGSTSRPKGIAITYANLAHFVAWLRDYLLADVTFGAVSGTVRHCFDVSLFELWAGWLRRRPLSALDHAEFANSRKYVERYAAHGVGLWVSTPSTVRAYLKDPRFDAAQLPALRTFLFCGETLAKPLVQQLRERFPRSRIVNTYGPTECTVAVTSVTIETHHLASSHPLPIGYARPGCTLALEDGQIVVRGAAVGAGYIRLPEKQAAAFPAPATYRTGDAGEVPDGALWYFGGRLDREVKILGARMDLAEIEAEIERVEGVETAFVEPVEIGGVRRALRAFLHGPADPADLSRVARRTAETLPPAMVPKFWRLCPDLRLNRNSKVDRAAMIDAAMARSADHVERLPSPPPRHEVDARALDGMGFLKVARAAAARHGPVVTLALPRGGRELTLLPRREHVRFWRENEALFVKDPTAPGSGAWAMRAVLGKTLQTSGPTDDWAAMHREMTALLGAAKGWFLRPLAAATRRLARELSVAAPPPLAEACLAWAARAVCDPLFRNPALIAEARGLLDALDDDLFRRMAALPPDGGPGPRERIDAAMRRLADGARSDSITEAILRAPDLAGGPEERMRRLVAGLLAASLHMNGLTLAWALRHLAVDPVLQRRIAEEGRPFGTGPRRLAQTPLAFAAVRETLRLCPVTAFVERQAAAPFALGGHAFRAGQGVLFSPLMTQTDPEWWPDPLRFDPDRFLGGRRVPRDAYLPFGVGRRTCPGAGLVHQQLTYALSVLCGEVELGLDPTTRPGDLGAIFRIVLGPRGPVRLRAVPALETTGA